MQGFNCPRCLKDASEANAWGLSETDGRVYQCPHCDFNFTEADALSNREVKEDIEADRADAKNDEAAMEEDLPF